MTRADRATALAALDRGDVVLLDTDTLPGLHARADLPGAAARIAALKGHPPERPYLLLVGSANEAFRLGSATSAAREDELRALWPAPLTALLSPRPTTPPEWTDQGRTVGVRVPDDPGLRELLNGLGAPLFSTSANRAGELPARTLDEAAAIFPGIPLLDLGIHASGTASALVDYTVEPPRGLRGGAGAPGADSAP